MNKILTVVLFGFLGWAFCGAIMGIGMSLTSMETTLIIHAIGAPVIFALLSFWYFKKYNYTGPLQTALSFLAIVMILDGGLVAPVIIGSYEMFQSFLGTWIPFILIFLSSYIVGKIMIN